MHFFTEHVSQFSHFRSLTIGLSLPFERVPSYMPTRPRLPIFHSTISLPLKKIPFSRFLMTSLHVICGLAPPGIKNPGYAYDPWTSP